MEFYQRVDWNDDATTDEKLHAVYNILNNLSREMSIGRVPQNKNELKNDIVRTRDELNVPLSIAFVKMAEAGEIDEVTAGEHVEMFLPWNDKTTYNVGDLRTREITHETVDNITHVQLTLFKCLQAHTAQVGWEPENVPALWKMISVNENGIPYWSRPISTVDSYMTGDECIYNGAHKRSTIDYNVWSPDEYPEGWEDVIE